MGKLENKFTQAATGTKNEEKEYMEYLVGFIRKLEKDLERKKKTYEAHLYSALDAIKSLESVGHSREEIISLLQTEPLSQWSKIHKRINASNEFKK